MIRSFCFFFFILTPFLYSKEEWVIHLQKEERLVPVCLLPFEPVGSDFSASYIKALEEVLQFDIDVSGWMTLQKEEALYQLHPRIEGKGFALTVSWGDQQERLELEKITLTGKLPEDRKLIHQVSDALIRSLFGQEGIASTQILYTLRTIENGKEYSEVWEADYDGKNAHLVLGKLSGYCVTPIYIPPKPGSRSGSLLYVSYLTGIPKMYAASLVEGKGKKVSSLSGNQLTPAISRQRDQIAYISDITGNPDLFLQGFSPEKGVLGKPRQLFTAPFATQSSPTFSPEGDRLAFVSSKGGSPRIYIIKIPSPGTPLKEIHPLLITKENRENTAPHWSPDGKKIVYSAMTQGVRQIWVYDVATGKETQVTKGPFHKENPVFAPNSLHVLYNTSEMGTCALYLIHLNRPNPVKIVGDGKEVRGDARFPAWQFSGI